MRFELTCSACPEQYDAYLGDRRVGYLRLRHGHFTVTCPDVGGELVYDAMPRGDGVFEDCERDGFMMIAEKAILKWLEEQNETGAHIPE